ncbi:MAG: endopeptidase La [Candidatus Latescibacterota bacterium]
MSENRDKPSISHLSNDKSPEDVSSYPEEMPLLPLRDVVLFPYMVVPILVMRESSIGALQAALVRDRFIFLVLQKEPEIEDPKLEDIHSTGVIGRALQVLKLPNGTAKVLVEGLVRGQIIGMEKAEDHNRVKVKIPKRTEDISSQFKALVRNVSNSFAMYVKLSKAIPDEVLMNLPPADDSQRLADTISAHLVIKQDIKQKLLDTHTVRAQLKLLSGILAEETEILQLEQNIDKEVRERLQKSQKDFYLHEQMRVIKEELGEDDEGDGEIKEMEERIKKSGMPKEASQKAMEELAKLRKMHMMSPESTVVRNYIDWLLSLPWKKRTRDNLDITKAKTILDQDHYGLEKPKERILEYLAVLKMAKKIRGPILCFTGPPGTGKTSLGKSVARALGRKFVRVSLGGIRDEAEIRGHRRTYIGSLPGRIIQNMKKAGTRNPVFLLDEIDKIGMDFRGDPSSALLEVLDPEQNNSFSDHFLEVDFDLSEVLFITTANFEDNIPAPLLDRMEIIRLSGYLEYEKVGIAEKHLIPKQMEACGLTPKLIGFDRETIVKIIGRYTAEAGVRNLERSIATICRKVVREVVTKGKKSKQYIITPRNLQKYLGVAKVQEKRVEKNDQVGMAVGLAWTPFGGEILSIETSLMPGKGELILTGHLGDVMKESARAALTYAKSNMKALGIREDAFDNKDVHIHVPEGAIPKDGPSAGVSIITSLVSAASGIPVSRNVAMTGEITLRGNVLPIGGLKEKSLAARRSGIKTIIIPKKNEADLSELPDEIKNGLTYILAEHIEDVLRNALTK